MLAYLALSNRRQEKARDVQNTSFQQPAKFIVVMYTVLSSLAACGRLGVAAAGVLFWHAAS